MTKTTSFQFAVDKKYFPSQVVDQQQFFSIEFEITKSAHHEFYNVLAIKIAPKQLNYLHWCPELYVEIRAAAQAHFLTNIDKEEFWAKEELTTK